MLFKHKVTYKGIEFDSKDEMMRYIDLSDKQCRGQISGLKRQVSFTLIPRQSKMVIKHLKTKDKVVEQFLENPAIYTCDFLYKEGETYVAEDVKSTFTKGDKSYVLRRKLMVKKIQDHNKKNHGQWIFREFEVRKKNCSKIIDR